MSSSPYSVGCAEVYADGGAMATRHNLTGPGNGFGCYAGTLNRHMTFADTEAARAAAACANEAYRQGYAAAQRDIRLALGIGR